MTLPRGYETVGSGGSFALPGERSWVERSLEDHGSLFAAAAREEDAWVLQGGRAPVYAVPRPGEPGRRVVRRYHRGGAVARLLGDRHLRMGEPRPVRELRASEEARRRGVPTPRVLAGAVYPAGLFYRADLVTEHVPASVDLAGALFGAGEGPDRTESLRQAGSLLARLAAAGVRHPDLNAGNVLLSDGGPLLLDLDRCRTTTDGAPVPPAAMLSRLERSLRKLGARRGRPLSDPEWSALRESALAAPPPNGRTP